MPKTHSRQNLIIDNGNQCCGGGGSINAIKSANTATKAAVNSAVSDTASY